MSLRRECGHRPDPDPENPDALFYRVLIGVACAIAYASIMILSGCASAPIPCPPPTERIVKVPEYIKCDVPLPKWVELPQWRACGDAACLPRDQAAAVAASFEALLEFVRLYRDRCGG